jgi:hypothetical protein
MMVCMIFCHVYDIIYAPSSRARSRRRQRAFADCR